MIFQDNIIKSYLENVYFMTGTPCGGKTTVSRALAEKHNIRIYDIDEMFPVHQKLSSEVFQPAMNKQFKDADEFFIRRAFVVSAGDEDDVFLHRFDGLYRGVSISAF